MHATRLLLLSAALLLAACASPPPRPRGMFDLSGSPEPGAARADAPPPTLPPISQTGATGRQGLP